MNEETRAIMIVGDVRKALKELCDYTGLDYALFIPDKKAEKAYTKLEKAYENFYNLPIQERLYASGMATPPLKGEGKD